jgi:hypothetical protein
MTRFSFKAVPGSPGPHPAAAAGILLAVNALLVFRLFVIEYTREMGSIEAAYIGLARYIHEHFGALNWFPLWYGGIPFQDAYPPLLHFLSAGVMTLARTSPGHGYHAVAAVVYVVSPVALFWTAERLGASRWNAFAAALLYSLLSPSCWLLREIRADSGGWFGPRRLITLVRYGETPHLASLLMLAAAIGMLHVALEKRRPLFYGFAVVSFAAVALCNWIGAFALALAIASYVLAGFPGAFPRVAAMGGCAYAVAMPWMPPSTIATIRANAPLVGGKYVAEFGYLALFAASLPVLAWALRAGKLERNVRFALLFLFATAFVSLGKFWFGMALVPQPERYHLEMDLAFWLAAAFVIPRLTAPVVLAVFLLLVPVGRHQYRVARTLERPIAIASTVEYEVSTWLGTHLPGRRVFAPGTTGFWMNAFSDTPLLTGGFDNGMRNAFLQEVIYQIYAGENSQVALDWLKAFGCDAVIGGDPESREVYHPVSHPERFHGLRELWRQGADVIYEVPRGTASLAHAVRRSDLVTQRPPTYDSTLLKGYLAALENPSLPAARFEWQGTGAAVITGDLRPELLLSVQITWDQGWLVRVNGDPRPTWADPIGQMVIEPRCAGPCRVELSYDGGPEMLLARVLSGLVLVGGAVWIVRSRRSRATAVHP